MKISLIMASISRTKEVEQFLQSLRQQTYKNFELIIVDQNDDDRLYAMANRYSDYFPVVHIQSEKGLSRARNMGMNHATGQIISFPDDDCTYSSLTLQQVADVFSSTHFDGVSGRMLASGTMLESCKQDCEIRLNIYNVWLKAVSTTLFLRRSLVDSVGYFDEKLGVGSGTEYGSGEETDYLIRAIKQGFSLYHVPSITVYHPEMDFNKSGISQKAYKYSKGRRYVLEKHKYNKVFIWINIFYPLVKLLKSLPNRNKTLYHWYQFLGRLE